MSKIAKTTYLWVPCINTLFFRLLNTLWCGNNKFRKINLIQSASIVTKLLLALTVLGIYCNSM